MVFATAIAACLLAYPGCGGPPEPAPPPVPDAKFAATYERSGGLKPMPQKVAITPVRQAAVTTQGPDGRPRTTRFRISTLKAHQLRAALSQAKFGLYEGDPSGSCADCYLYTLEFRGHSISFTEAEIPIWIRKTVGRFEALVEAHRPFH